MATFSIKFITFLTNIYRTYFRNFYIPDLECALYFFRFFMLYFANAKGTKELFSELKIS